VESEPVMASFPDQACEATQAVAFADDHDSIAALPLITVLGVALRVTVGAGELTVTVADCAAAPPEPVQLSVYVAFAVRAAVDCDPLTAMLPDQPPDAVQAVALVLAQVNVELWPLATVLGFALRVTVGAGATEVIDTEAA
jgi:hypothetical protein